MSTCGFDHIRQPEIDDGVGYPLHGGMMHQPTTILAAGPEWQDEACVFRVVAEATQFSLERGTAIRLRRTITVPLGGRSLALADDVTVLSGALPVMAMYHVNLGFPLAGPDSRLRLGDADVTDAALGSDGVRTRPTRPGRGDDAPAGDGRVTASLAGSAAPDAPRFDLTFDAGALPVFQTLRNARPGINLTCLEPATHERLPRAELRRRGDLEAVPAGTTRRLALTMAFHA
jgi:hypothetical protein